MSVCLPGVRRRDPALSGCCGGASRPVGIADSKPKFVATSCQRAKRSFCRCCRRSLSNRSYASRASFRRSLVSGGTSERVAWRNVSFTVPARSEETAANQSEAMNQCFSQNTSNFMTARLQTSHGDRAGKAASIKQTCSNKKLDKFKCSQQANST